MGIILLAFSEQPKFCFLRRIFPQEELHKLRVGHLTYMQQLKNIPALHSAITIFCLELFPIELSDSLQIGQKILLKEGIHPQPDDQVIFFNMTFYPLDINWLNHLLLKASETDVPLLVHGITSSGARIAFFCIRYRLLKEGAQPDIFAKCVATTEQMPDLLHPQTVLQLFSSNFSLRYFNSLRIHRDTYFLKQSNKTDKIRSEYHFLSNVPSAIRTYFPHVGDFLEFENSAAYEIEIIPQIDVAKSLLNGLFASDDACRLFVSAVERYLNACPRKEVSREDYVARAHSCFTEKTQQRVEQTLRTHHTLALDNVCRLQGLESFNAFAAAALHALEDAVNDDEGGELWYSHGDLFFSNMIFDPVQGVLKLIDPRGYQQEDPFGAYLPPWYDLAKLSHSFLGLYDLMVYDLVDIVMQPDLALTLRPRHVPGLDNLATQFNAMLKRLAVDVKRVRLYEASLFLSMIPLHSDSPLRMQQQLLRAIQLFKTR